MPHHLHSLGAALAIVSLGSIAAAQVPDGWLVVTTLETGPPTRFPPRDTGGVFLVDASTPSVAPPLIHLTGLPIDLTGVSGGPRTGACCVAVQGDGLILVGECGAAGDSVELFELELQGTNATVTRTAFAGTSGNIREIALLPDGDAILQLGNMDNGPPLFGARLARWSRRNNTITPWQTDVTGPLFGGLGTSPDGTTVYVATPNGTAGADLRAIPITGSPSRMVAALFTSFFSGIFTENDGTIVVGTLGQSQRFDPTTGNALQPAFLGLSTAFDIDRATGRYVIGQTGTPDSVGLANPPGTTPGGLRSAIFAQGLLSDVTILSNPHSYGQDTPGNASFRWVTAPSPGGTPQRGNRTFELRLDASSGDSTGVGWIGPTLDSRSVLGIELLVVPDATFPIPASGILALPLAPSVPLGLRVFFQTFHLDAGGPAGVAASNGLTFTITQ